MTVDSWESMMQAEDLQAPTRRNRPEHHPMVHHGENDALWPPERLAEAIAQQVATLLPQFAPKRWLNKAEAIEYSRIQRGTFEKYAADGRIPSHGGKTKVFDRDELDEALRRL